MATAWARAPVAVISPAVVSRLPGRTTGPAGASARPSPSWTVRALMTTSQPARASAMAAHRPIPRLAPVTSATGRSWVTVCPALVMAPAAWGGPGRTVHRWTGAMTWRLTIPTLRWRQTLAPGARAPTGPRRRPNREATVSPRWGWRRPNGVRQATTEPGTWPARACVPR